MLKSSKLYLKGSQDKENSILSNNKKGLLNGWFKYSLYSCILPNQSTNFKEFSINNKLVNNSNNPIIEKEIPANKSIELTHRNIRDISKFMPSISKDTNFTSNTDLLKYSENVNFKNYKDHFNENKNIINKQFQGIIKTCKNIFDDIYEDELLNKFERISISKKNIIDEKNILGVNHKKIKNNFLQNLLKNIDKLA